VQFLQVHLAQLPALHARQLQVQLFLFSMIFNLGSLNRLLKV